MSFEFPKNVTVQWLDDGGHCYAKIPAQLLCDMDIHSRISPYSYLGAGEKSWNEKGYAFLEEDCDFPLFHKACGFWKIEYDEDYVTLQEDFDENCEDTSAWTDEEDDDGETFIASFHVDNLDWLGIEAENFVSIDTWKELNAYLAKTEEDDDELPNDSDSSD